jgi:hypothetical protein
LSWSPWFADSYIAAAAADIDGHGLVDIGVVWFRVGGQERGCGHNLLGLAIATLHDFQIEPDPGGDLGVSNAVDGRGAGVNRIAVLVYSAGAAQRHTATKLRARHAEQVAQYPKQWRVAVRLYDVDVAIETKPVEHLHSPECVD